MGAYSVLIDQLLHVMTRPWVRFCTSSNVKLYAACKGTHVGCCYCYNDWSDVNTLTDWSDVNTLIDWSDVNTLIDFESQLTSITCLY